MQAPVVITDKDHWSGFRPDKINELAELAVTSVA
jgi:glutaredoxin-like protein NrdH